MKMKKITSLLLAVLLIVSVFAACGGNDTSGTSSSSEESSAAGESTSTAEGEEESSESAGEDDLMTPYGKYPEVIEIHTAKPMSVQPNFPEGDTVDNNVMTRYILDKLNVKTVTDWEVESTQFANKLALMLASNDLPDMFTLGTADYLLYQQMRNNDLLADVSEAVDKCSDEYMRSAFESFEYKNLDPFREGEELYAIAGCNFGYGQPMLWLRKDWLDQAGIKELPTTLEDIENILTTWKENPPSDNYVGMPLHYSNVAGGYWAALCPEQKMLLLFWQIGIRKA